LADGYAGCVDAGRLIGNAIVPFLAAQVLGAILDLKQPVRGGNNR
jgi:hypothetical protein